MPAYARRAVLFLCAALFAPLSAQEAKSARRRERGIAGLKPQAEKMQGTVSRIGDPKKQDFFGVRIQQIKDHIKEDMRDLPPKLKRLEELTDSYESLADLSEVEPERSDLRNELAAGAARLDENAIEFHQIRKDYQFQQGVLLFSKMVSGQSDDSIHANYEVLFDLGNYDKESVLAYKKKISAALADDQTKMQFILDERERIKRHKRYLAGAGAAFGLSIITVFLFAKRKRGRPPRSASLPAPGTPPCATPAPRPIAAAPSGPEDAVGKTLDENVRVDALLRNGPLGPVYEATHLIDGSKLILKCVLEEFHRTESDVDRFYLRMEQLAGFTHAALAETRKVFRVENRIYIATQRIAGVPLSRFVDPTNQIELRSIKLIVSQIAFLLDAAHDRKLIHGDISPANVIVMENGAVKVLDLGLGLEARKRIGQLGLSKKVGDPAYFAPEQEMGGEFRQSDFYSLGVVSYAMLTGRTPFTGPNYLAQKRERRYPPASSFSNKIPVEVDPILHKAMEPEPPQRYQKGAEFFNALDAVPDRIDA